MDFYQTYHKHHLYQKIAFQGNCIDNIIVFMMDMSHCTCISLFQMNMFPFFDFAICISRTTGQFLIKKRPVNL